MYDPKSFLKEFRSDSSTATYAAHGYTPRLVRLGWERVHLYLIDGPYCDQILTHYDRDMTADGYFRCGGGDSCLVCRVLEKSKPYLYLPTYNMDTHRVEYLRVSLDKKNPVLGLLSPFLAASGHLERTVYIERRGKVYHVDPTSYKHFTAKTDIIKAFANRIKSGDFDVQRDLLPTLTVADFMKSPKFLDRCEGMGLDPYAMLGGQEPDEVLEPD